MFPSAGLFVFDGRGTRFKTGSHYNHHMDTNRSPASSAKPRNCWKLTAQSSPLPQLRKGSRTCRGTARLRRATRQGSEKLKELPGIGDRMVEHLNEILKTGDYALRKKLLKKYPASILDVLQLQSLGPKKAALLWKKFKAGSVPEVEKIALEGKLRDVPGFGEKSEQNILKAVESFKRLIGRFLLQGAEVAAEALQEHIAKAGKLAESVTPAGSLRRGKETIGDLDLLVTLADGFTSQKHVDALAEAHPPIPRHRPDPGAR